MLVDTLLRGLVPDVGRFTPNAVSDSLTAGVEDYLLSPGTAGCSCSPTPPRSSAAARSSSRAATSPKPLCRRSSSRLGVLLLPGLDDRRRAAWGALPSAVPKQPASVDCYGDLVAEKGRAKRPRAPTGACQCPAPVMSATAPILFQRDSSSDSVASARDQAQRGPPKSVDTRTSERQTS